MLEILEKLFERLHKNGVRYCHYKSNEHLQAALEGLTDLDLLVCDDDHIQFESCALSDGFKIFKSLIDIKQPGVVDFLGVDKATGRFCHLHVHFQLVLGEKRLKGYRLPWAERIIGDSIECLGVKIASPEWEMLLLIVRTRLKLRYRDFVFGGIGKDAEKEFDYLKSRVNQNNLIDLIEEIFPNRTDKVKRIMQSGMKISCLRSFLPLDDVVLYTARTYSKLGSFFLRHWNEMIWIFGGCMRRLNAAASPSKRISMRGGLVVVVLGCDGSGKSTLVAALRKWISWKIDCTSIYYGAGGFLFRTLCRIKGAQLKKESSVKNRLDTGGASSLIRVAWAIMVAFRKKKVQRMQVRLRNQGSVVIADRFPQANLAGYGDGPLIRPGGPLTRKISLWEIGVYKRFSLTEPDLVLKLLIDPKIAYQRKPEGDFESIKIKSELVASMNFSQATTVDIDATLSAQEVLQRAKLAIWERL